MVVGCQPLTGDSMRWIKDTVSGLPNPHDAAARNRVAKMHKYVQHGGDVNKPNKLGDTPLHEACSFIRDNGDSCKGKKRKAVGKDRRRVGKKLSQRGLGEGGPLEMLELLLKAGSDINSRNIVGDAPLHKAALNGRALSADFLIRSGANVNIRNEFDQTPLHSACMSGNIDVVRKLVNGGADTGAQDAAEDTPFHEACRHQYEGIVTYLMGLVSPKTSEGLELLQRLNPSLEKMLRSRAPPAAEYAQQGAEVPAKPGHVRMGSAHGHTPQMGITTPSTTHNSLQSSGSARGLGLPLQTPSRGEQLSRVHRSSNGGVSVTVRTSQTESLSPPAGARPTGRPGEQPLSSETRMTDSSNKGQASIDKASGTAGGSRTRGPSKRGREARHGDMRTSPGVPRSFSTGPTDVLNWQATKVKNVQQGRLIEKAREALREEQKEAALAMTSATLGDDDASVETLKTADTSATMERSGSNGGRKGGTAITDGERNVTPPAARKRGVRDGASAAAGRASRAVSEVDVAIPAMPTPPAMAAKDIQLRTPTRDGVRRSTARKSKGAVQLRSPVPRMSQRHLSGNREAPRADESRRPSRRRRERASGSRSSSSSRRLVPDPADVNATVDVSMNDSEVPAGGDQRSRSRRTEPQPHSGVGGDGQCCPTHSDGRRENTSVSGGQAHQRQPRRRSEGGADATRDSVGRDGVLRDSAGRRVSREGREGRSSTSRRSDRQQRRQEAGEMTSAATATAGGATGELPPRSPSRQSAGRRTHVHQPSRSRAEVVGDRPVSSSRGEVERHGATAEARRSSSRGSGEPSRSAGAGGSGVVGEERRRSSGSRRESGRRESRRSSSSRAGVGAGDEAAVKGHEESKGATAAMTTTAAAEGKVKVTQPTRTSRTTDSLSRHFLSHGTEEGRTEPAVVAAAVAAALQAKTDVTGAKRAPPADRGEMSSNGRGGESGRLSDVMTPKRRGSGVSGGLRPPSWASDVSTGFGDKTPVMPKRVIESALPLKRNSPYRMKAPASLQSGGIPRVGDPTSKKFFSSTPPVQVPTLVVMHDRADEDSARLEAAAGNSCCGSAFPDSPPKAPIGNGGFNGASKIGRTEKSVDETRGKMKGASRTAAIPDHSTSTAAPTRVAPFFASVKESGVGRNSQASKDGGYGGRVTTGSPPTLPEHSVARATGRTAIVEDDAPPGMAALEMEGSKRMSVEVEIAPAVMKKEETMNGLKDTKRTSWVFSADKTPSTSEAVPAKAKPGKVLFSDSDTDEEQQPSTVEGPVASRGSFSFGERTTSFNTLTAKSFAEALQKCGVSTGLLGHDKVGDTGADESASAVSAGSGNSEKAVGGGGSGGKELKSPEAGGGAAPAALRPPPKRAVSNMDHFTTSVAPKVPQLPDDDAVRDDKADAPGEASDSRTDMSIEEPIECGAEVPSGVQPDARLMDADTSAVPYSAPVEQPDAVATPAADLPVTEPRVLEAMVDIGESDESTSSASPSHIVGVDCDNALGDGVGSKWTRGPVEPSAAPRVPSGIALATSLPWRSSKTTSNSAQPETSLQAPDFPQPQTALSQTADLSPRFSLGGGGVVGARPRSMLGRSGTLASKVTMPIVGGRAAWNKFLADADVNDDAAASTVGVDEDAQEDGSDDANAESDTPQRLSEARAPRGFKQPIGQGGPNKGPAGAYSGNAMWRLAGGAKSAAGRAKAGVSANGHGGYSNPLAAMRAGGGGSGFPASREPGATNIANPLAGLRGASGMGGAGVSNPLARRRGGPSSRMGAGNAMANPMLSERYGGAGSALQNFHSGPKNGIANPLAAAAAAGMRTRSNSSAGELSPTATAVFIPPVGEGNMESNGDSDSDGASEFAPVINTATLPAPPTVVPDVTPPVTNVPAAEESSKLQAVGAADSENGMAEFRAIGSDGNWAKAIRLPPPSQLRGRALQRIEQENKADRNPGQARVASVVMAIQKPTGSGVGLTIRDPQHVEMSNVAEQGLVRLRRVEYSPRPICEEDNDV